MSRWRGEIADPDGVRLQLHADEVHAIAELHDVTRDEDVWTRTVKGCTVIVLIHGVPDSRTREALDVFGKAVNEAIRP